MSLGINVKSFFTNLQGATPGRKFRWLILLSAVSFLIIIGLWIGYLNFIGSNSPEAALIRKDTEPGFFEKISINVSSGVEILRRRTANMIYFFDQKFSQTNTIQIDNDTNQRIDTNATNNNK